MSCSPPTTAEEFAESVIVQVRDWRWSTYPSVPRGWSPWQELRDSDATHQEKCLLERIDAYDAAAGAPEPPGSIKLRARRKLEEYDRNGLDDAEAARVLAWLDDPREDGPA